MRISPRPIFQAHFRALAREVPAGSSPENKQSKTPTGQYLGLLALSVVAGAASYVSKLVLSESGAAAVLSISGVFAAFAFHQSVQLLDRSAAWSESQPRPSAETSTYARLLEDLSAHVAYATLVAITSVLMTVALALMSSEESLTILSALVIAVLTHLTVTVLLIVRRTFLLTQARLLAARTGTSGSD